MQAAVPTDASWEPVNVAVPMWACPHCGHNYRGDYDAACACAQLGPAPDIVAGIPFLALTGSRPGVFGVAQPGPVRVERDDERRMVAHRRDLRVGSTNLDTRGILGGSDRLVVIGERTRASVSHVDAFELGRDTDWVAKMFGVTESYGRKVPWAAATPPAVWVRGVQWSSADRWLAPLDHDQRAGFDTLTAGMLARLAAADRAELHTAIVASYDPQRRRSTSRTTATVPGMYEHATGVAIARAHGAPNLIWAHRWLTTHLDRVAAWHADALVTWAAGGQVAIPRPPRCWYAESLPTNPGKKRLAVIARWGDSYRAAWMQLIAELTVAAPGPVVAGLGDVIADVRAVRAAHCPASHPSSNKDLTDGRH